MTTPDYWPTIGHEHWTGTSYDQAMQQGRPSWPSPMDPFWSLDGRWCLSN